MDKKSSVFAKHFLLSLNFVLSWIFLYYDSYNNFH